MVVPRLRSQPRTVLAVVAGAVLTATSAAAAPMLAAALAGSGLDDVLARTSPSETAVEVEVHTSAERVAMVVPTLEVLLETALGGWVAPPDIVVDAGPVHVRGQPDDVLTPVVVAESYTRDVFADRDLLAAVRVGTGPYRAQPVQLHEGALVALGVDVGQVLVTDTGAVVQVAGTLAPRDAGDRRWWGDALGRDGTLRRDGVTLAGPLYVTTPQDLEPILGDDPPVVVRLRTLPVPGALTPAALVPLADGADGVVGRVELALGWPGLAERWEVRVPLADAAREASLALDARRSAALVGLGVVAMLAALGTAAAGRGLRAGRAQETMVLRARGASAGQLVRVAVTEGVVLVVPAVLVAPWLAAVATGTQAGPDRQAVVGAGMAGLVCIAALVGPVVWRVGRTEDDGARPAVVGAGRSAGSGLLPWLDVRRNVEVPMAVRGMAPAARRRRATALLQMVGLADRTGDRPGQLSRSGRLRAVMAMTLAGPQRERVPDRSPAAPGRATAVVHDVPDGGPRPRWGPDGERLDD